MAEKPYEKKPQEIDTKIITLKTNKWTNLFRGIVVYLNYLSYWVEKCELHFFQFEIYLEQDSQWQMHEAIVVSVHTTE